MRTHKKVFFNPYLFLLLLKHCQVQAQCQMETNKVLFLSYGGSIKGTMGVVVHKKKKEISLNKKGNEKYVRGESHPDLNVHERVQWGVTLLAVSTPPDMLRLAQFLRGRQLGRQPAQLLLQPFIR